MQTSQLVIHAVETGQCTASLAFRDVSAMQWTEAGTLQVQGCNASTGATVLSFLGPHGLIRELRLEGRWDEETMMPPRPSPSPGGVLMAMLLPP